MRFNLQIIMCYEAGKPRIQACNQPVAQTRVVFIGAVTAVKVVYAGCRGFGRFLAYQGADLVSVNTSLSRSTDWEPSEDDGVGEG